MATSVTKTFLSTDTRSLYREDSSATPDGIFTATQDVDGTPTVFTRQSQRLLSATEAGLFPNGSNLSSRLTALAANASVTGIFFDTIGADSEYVFNSAVTLPDNFQLVFYAGNKLGGSGSITGGTVVAPYNQRIIDDTITFNPSYSHNGEFSVMWTGALGNDGQDESPYIQKAIDICLRKNIGTLRIPRGKYRCYTGLNVRVSAGAGQPATFCSLTITGDCKPYDGNGEIAAATTLYGYDPLTFVINVQLVKGCIIQKILFAGINTISPSPIETFSNTYVWNQNGTRDNRFSPYSAIVVDGFGRNTVLAGNRYPGFEDLYTQTGNSGSSDVTIRDCKIRNFVVGIMVSPNGTTQNSEVMHFYDNWIDYNKVQVATGNSQTRTVFVDNITCWRGETLVDSSSYGDGTGQIPEVRGANLAGAVKWICKSSWAQFPYVKLSDIYAESIYAIGGDISDIGNDGQGDYGGKCYMWLNNCELHFAGGEGMDASFAPIIAKARQISFKQCMLTYYAHVKLIPFPVNAHVITVDDCVIYGPVTDINNRPTTYINTSEVNIVPPINSNGETYSPSFENGVFIPAKNSFIELQGFKRTYTNDILKIAAYADAAITIITPYSLSFPVSMSHVASVFVGDFVFFQGFGGTAYTNIETYSTGVNFFIGQVSAVNTGTGVVTIVDVPSNFDLSAGQFRFIIKAYNRSYKTHVGNITSGSPNITTIVGEGQSSSQELGAGYFLSGPEFRQWETHLVATRVLSTGSGTAVLSQNALATKTSLGLFGASYKQSVINNYTDTIALTTKIAFKQGDEIENNFLYSADDNVFKWVCSKAGILNTANLPEFIALEGVAAP